MNWFTWALIIFAAVALAALVKDLVRPRAGGVRHAKQRERDHGEGILRGGEPNRNDGGSSAGF